jgi:hypothetical protein
MPRLGAITNQLFQNSGIRYLPPTIYTLTPAANNVNEGSSLTFTVSGSNIVNGTYYWTVSRPEDFSVSSGSFTITSNSGSFSVTPTADTTTEGAETFTVSIRSGSTSGTILQTSSSVTINDTSLTPDVTSFFGASGQSIVVSSPRLSLITTDQARFGTKSLQKTPINGTGDRSNAVNIPLSQTLGAPMTLEAWVWIGVGFADPNFENGPEIYLHGPAVDVATTFPANFITLRGIGANTFGITCGTTVSRVPPDGTSSSFNDQNNGGIPLNTWTHIALSYSNNTTYAVWVNGIRRLRNSWSSGYGLSQVMTQLTVNPTGNVGPHYIDEIRVSNIDRYGVDNTTLTVPLAEFVSDANTVALVKF